MFPNIGAEGSLTRERTPDDLSLLNEPMTTSRYAATIGVSSYELNVFGANLDYAEVRKDIRIAEYEKAIQTAFREVADGLAARGSYKEQVRAQTSLVATTSEYVELAEARYQSGVDTVLLWR